MVNFLTSVINAGGSVAARTRPRVASIPVVCTLQKSLFERISETG
jgi:hypothetical protein